MHAARLTALTKKSSLNFLLSFAQCTHRNSDILIQSRSLIDAYHDTTGDLQANCE